MLWRVSCALRDVWNYLWPYMCAKSLQSCPTLWDPMDWSLQGPLSMGFSWQEYWSGLPCPSPGIHGYYSPDALDINIISMPSFDNQKCLQYLLNVLWGQTLFSLHCMTQLLLPLKNTDQRMWQRGYRKEGD